MDKDIVVIPCDESFMTDAEKEEFVNNRYVQEAFLRFCVRGAQKYLALRDQGKSLKDVMPGHVKEATRKYKEEQSKKK